MIPFFAALEDQQQQKKKIIKMSKSTMKSKISPSSGSGASGTGSSGGGGLNSLTHFKSSQNYLWNTNAVLGKGATGAVYFGHNKHSGDTVAVKCFNHLSHMRPYEVQKREFEVLKKVNHENIVRLLAIEEEVSIFLVFVFYLYFNLIL